MRRPDTPSARLPIVGVTARRCVVQPRAEPDVEVAFVPTTYLDAVRSAGMLPLLLPPGDPADADAALDAVDALLLSGGEDVDPAYYAETPHPASGPFAAARDAWESALVRRAYERRVPTLAICRGAQLLNVALGGALTQHLGDDAERGARHDRASLPRCRVHPVTLTAGDALAAVLGATTVDVNSYHHQAIARVAPPLVAVARADDGVVEAVAAREASWPAFGVQWHPEDLVGDGGPCERRLFAWLAVAAAARAAR